MFSRFLAALFPCQSKVRQETLGANVYAYSAAISVCARARQWEKALELLVAMELEGVSPNAYSYAGVISACARGDQWTKVPRIAVCCEIRMAFSPVSLLVSLLLQGKIRLTRTLVGRRP